jgi:hypothetical protein
MDKMSLFALCTTSFPEAILNLYIGFTVIGLRKDLLSFPFRENLILGVKNSLKLILALVLMLISTFIIRSSVPVGVMTLLLHVITYILILKIIYRINILKIMTSVIGFTGILLTIEALYLPPFFELIHYGDLGSEYTNDLLRIIYSLPDRIVQFLFIIFATKSEAAFISIKDYPYIHKIACKIMALLYFGEAMLLFTFLKAFDKIDVITKVFSFAACITFPIVNLLFFRFILKYGEEHRKNKEYELEKQRQETEADALEIRKLLGG